MERAAVWIRPLANVCLVRVEGNDRASWLLERLSRLFVFKTSEPVMESQGSPWFTFRLAYSSAVPQRKLEQVLASIPEIQLLLDRDKSE